MSDGAAVVDPASPALSSAQLLSMGESITFGFIRIKILLYWAILRSNIPPRPSIAVQFCTHSLNQTMHF